MIQKQRINIIAIVAIIVFLPMKSTSMQMINCLEEIISKYFTPEQVIVFSLPATPSDMKQRSLLLSEDTSAIDILLSRIGQKEIWPLIISRENNIDDYDIAQSQHGYMVLLMYDEKHPNIVDTLVNQIMSLRGFAVPYNRKGIFVIAVLNWSSGCSYSISKQILNRLWKSDKILNAIVLISAANNNNCSSTKSQELDKTPLYDVYSLFPFESERCGMGEDVILLDQWTHEGRFLNGSKLLPPKVPKQLNGCSLSTSACEYFAPFVMVQKNHSARDGEVTNELIGIEMLVLKFIKEVMNFSVKIQPIYSKTLLETYIKSFLRLLEGDTDIAIGGMPMWSEFNIFGDPTIWYTQAETGLYVPCARPKAVSGNILKVFTTQVWLLSIAVLLLVATLIWHHLNMGFAPKSHTSFTSSILNVWAILLSVSTENRPPNMQYRLLLFLIIYFSFVMNIVFQSFFISFMIEPGFEDEIKSIEDLNDRHIPIAMEPPLEKLIELLDLKYEGKYIVQCPLYYKCTYDMFRYRNVSTFVERRFIEFIGTTIYEAPLNRGVRKNYCPIMSFGKFPLLMYFQKGDPLLDRFNVLIRRCLEGGFLDIFAVEVKTGTTLVELKNGFQASFPLPTDEDKELLKQEDSTVYEVLRPSHFKT